MEGNRRDSNPHKGGLGELNHLEPPTLSTTFLFFRSRFPIVMQQHDSRIRAFYFFKIRIGKIIVNKRHYKKTGTGEF
jgi:hypothetical protein